MSLKKLLKNNNKPSFCQAIWLILLRDWLLLSLAGDSRGGGPPKHLRMQIFGGGKRLAGPARNSDCGSKLKLSLSIWYSSGYCGIIPIWVVSSVGQSVSFTPRRSGVRAPRDPPNGYGRQRSAVFCVFFKITTTKSKVP